MDSMSHADLAAHYAAQATRFHDLAQKARKHALAAKDQRRWLDKLKLDDQAREYRNARDSYKGKSKEHAALA